MKHFRLLMTLFALTLGWTNVSAQTWTASEVETGNFYLYNVGKAQFLTRGNGWQTQASTGFNALTLIVEEYNGAYKLRTNVNGDGKGLERLSDPVIYTDQSSGKNSTWTFTKVADASNGPVYTIVSAENHGGGAGSYMTANADNTIVGPADAVTDDYGRWQLFQSWITNTMPVTNTDGWTVSETPTFDAGNICAEFWNKSGASIKQTVDNLPAGSYELIAVALTREGMTATLHAGTNTMNIAVASTSEVNNRAQANTWFNAGNGVNRLEFTHAGGSLEIGLTADNTTGDHWLVWRSFVLLYKGLDLSELKAALQAQIDAVLALEGTTTEAAYNAAKNYADGIDMDALTTEEAISAASTELANLVNAAVALQVPYSRYKEVKAACVAVNGNLDTTLQMQRLTLLPLQRVSIWLLLPCVLPYSITYPPQKQMKKIPSTLPMPSSTTRLLARTWIIGMSRMLDGLMIGVLVRPPILVKQSSIRAPLISIRHLHSLRERMSLA